MNNRRLRCKFINDFSCSKFLVFWEKFKDPRSNMPSFFIRHFSSLWKFLYIRTQDQRSKLRKEWSRVKHHPSFLFILSNASLFLLGDLNHSSRLKSLHPKIFLENTLHLPRERTIILLSSRSHKRDNPFIQRNWYIFPQSITTEFSLRNCFIMVSKTWQGVRFNFLHLSRKALSILGSNINSSFFLILSTPTHTYYFILYKDDRRINIDKKRGST